VVRLGRKQIPVSDGALNRRSMLSHPHYSARMPVLITGGAGFIASNFVRSWFEAGGGALVNLDKLTYAGNPRNLEGLPA
jgi:dTDP-glucose 4,6-dehydratase